MDDLKSALGALAGKTGDSTWVALQLDIQVTSFRNRRKVYEAAGMPSPLPLPGYPRWIKQEILDWIESLSSANRQKAQAQPVAETADTPQPAQVEQALPKKRAGRPKKSVATFHTSAGEVMA